MDNILPVLNAEYKKIVEAKIEPLPSFIMAHNIFEAYEEMKRERKNNNDSKKMLKHC